MAIDENVENAHLSSSLQDAGIEQAQGHIPWEEEEGEEEEQQQQQEKLKEGLKERKRMKERKRRRGENQKCMV